MANISTFKSKLIGGGARNNRFEIRLNFPGYVTAAVPSTAVGNLTEYSSFMCKAGSLPASSVPQIDVAYKGRQVKVAGDRVFENWSVTMYNDNNFALRNALEIWMDGVNKHEENIGYNKPDEYMMPLDVHQLSRSNEKVKSYKIVGAYPVSVEAIELDYSTNDQIEEFAVEFAYQYWTSEWQTKNIKEFGWKKSQPTSTGTA